MKQLLYGLVVLALFFSIAAPADADFELVRKIPAPLMYCETGTPLIKAMGSDGTYLCLTRGCYADYGARVIRVDPDDGEIVNDDYWNYDVPECQGLPLPISMSYCPYDGSYYVGTDCGAIVGLMWMAPDSAWDFTTYSLGDSLQIPSGMAPGQYSFLFASDRADTDLVQFESIGMFMSDSPMYGVDTPVAMASLDQHLFVLDGDNAFIVEMDIEAVNVDTHYVEDWEVGGPVDSFTPMAATFLGGELYLAGNGDSIHIYELVEQLSYTEPVPPGDNVEVVIIPEALVVTFDAVTDSGDINVDVSESDDCAPPAGVTLFPEYYDIGTDATFEYIAEVAVLDSVFPLGVDQDLVRVFSRRSDTCLIWRDITVAPIEEIPVLKILRRSKSEDDEFSVFALGEDNRTPQEVIEFKIDDLRGHIISAEDSVPETAYSDLLENLAEAESDYYRGVTGGAVEGVSGMDDIVRDNPSIPHTYNPEDPGRNVAGRIIGRAHTLEFSLGFSGETRFYSSATAEPRVVHVGLNFAWFTVYIEVPSELTAAEVDFDHIYLENEVRAAPESVLVYDYDTDGAPEIRAMFPGRRAQLALAASGCSSVANTSCFVSGFELHSAADIDLFEPTVEVASEIGLLSGTAAQVSWERLDCNENPFYRLAFSADAGASWTLVASEIADRHYEWMIPDVETESGLLRVACDDGEGQPIAVYSGLLTIESGAGLDVEAVTEFRLAIRPNPAGGTVEIELASPRGERASVTVYSVRGELVATIFEGRVEEGRTRLVWRGDNSAGVPVSAGTYFVVLRTETGTVTKKLIVQR